MATKIQPPRSKAVDPQITQIFTDFLRTDEADYRAKLKALLQEGAKVTEKTASLAAPSLSSAAPSRF